MSVVTNVLVLTSYTPTEVCDKLSNGFVCARGGTISFVDIARYHGGPEKCPADFWPGKVPECEVWVSAPNHADPDEIATWLRTLPWRYATAMHWLTNGMEPSDWEVAKIFPLTP